MLQHKIITGVAVVAALAATTLCTPDTYATGEDAAVESAISSLKTTHQATVDAYNTSHADMQLHIVDGSDCYGPFYRASSMKAYTQVDGSLCFETQTAEGVMATLVDASPMISALTSSGFTAYSPEYYWPPHQQYLNENTGVICSVAEYGANCGHINQQTITDKWAEYLNGIGAAYYAAEQEYPVITDRSIIPSDNNTSPVINNSDYESYQYTSIGIQNATSLFYRSSPTSEWIYFKSTQELIDCNEYTGETQKAFAGYDCYDSTTNTNSKVGVSTNTSDSSSGDTSTKDSDSSTLGVPDTGISTNDDSSAISTEKILIVIASTAVVVTISVIAAYRLQRRHVVRTFSRK